MKLLRVKDNRLMPKSDFAPIQRVVDKIADKTLSELEKEGIFFSLKKSMMLRILRKSKSFCKATIIVIVLVIL